MVELRIDRYGDAFYRLVGISTRRSVVATNPNPHKMSGFRSQTGVDGMSEFVKVELQNGVGRVTLNRPDKRNALLRQFIEELDAAVRRLAADDSLRVLVLNAEGSVFCAGMDLGEMQQRASSEDGKAEWHRDSQVYSDLLSRLFQLTVPTVAVLQGPVLAGGVGYGAGL